MDLENILQRGNSLQQADFIGVFLDFGNAEGMMGVDPRGILSPMRLPVSPFGR
jgi:hypothetical protein